MGISNLTDGNGTCDYMKIHTILLEIKTKLYEVTILYKLILFQCDFDLYKIFLLISIMKLNFNCKNKEVKILGIFVKKNAGEIAPSNVTNGTVYRN